MLFMLFWPLPLRPILLDRVLFVSSKPWWIDFCLFRASLFLQLKAARFLLDILVGMRFETDEFCREACDVLRSGDEFFPSWLPMDCADLREVTPLGPSLFATSSKRGEFVCYWFIDGESRFLYDASALGFWCTGFTSWSARLGKPPMQADDCSFLKEPRFSSGFKIAFISGL